MRGRLLVESDEEEGDVMRVKLVGRRSCAARLRLGFELQLQTATDGLPAGGRLAQPHEAGSRQFSEAADGTLDVGDQTGKSISLYFGSGQ